MYAIACYCTLAVDLSRPYTVLGTHLTNEVLVALARTTRPLSGREVARITGRSDRRVRQILHDLVAHGLVHQQEAPPALLFTLNREHVAAPIVEQLANLRREFERRVRAEIESWEVQPAHASIFGSAARGDGDTSSDIDIFIVRPDRVTEDNPVWRQQLEQLAVDVRNWSGNRAGIAEVAQRELARLRREQPPVVADLRADAVTLAGPPLAELFKGRR